MTYALLILDIIIIVLLAWLLRKKHHPTCSHIFTNPIDEKGNQYCTKCGKLEHSHIWEPVEKINHTSYGSPEPIGITTIYRCKGCGLEKQTKV